MLNPLHNRTLSITGAALPMYGDQPILTPVKLSGGETLGQLFEYTLELKTPDSLSFSPSIAANIDLNKLIGTEVTVSIELEGKGQFIPGLRGNAGMGNIGAGTREITGVVSSASIVREDGRTIVYELTLSAWLWHATKNKARRLFQDMTVIEITDAVLAAYLFPVDKRLTTPRPNKAWPKRDIQRQHDESDYTFLQRLWEEWGIFYFFEHSEGKQRLVLCDSIATLKRHGEAYETIRYEPSNGRRIDEEHIHELSVLHKLTPGAVKSSDYDYTLPRADLTVKREDPRDTGLANQEHFTWGDFAQPQAGATGLSGEHNDPRLEAAYLTIVQMQAFRCQGVRVSGRGNLRGLVTGRTFELSHYPQHAANREYAVIASKLSIEEVGESSGSGQRYRCETQFTLQPSNEPFRLLRTVKKPKIGGLECAVVTCPEGQEIWTDAYGRVKVQFHWDQEGKHNERSSCWMRVAVPWQGNQFGATFLPRRGQEVQVGFINGDPDLPIIVGSVVNAFNMPAHALPSNQALSAIRSREIDGGRSNGLVFDDTNGKIQVQLGSDEGSSQLNLGYITRIAGNAGRQDERGIGTELRTDGHGVFRAGKGMLLTTEARSGGQGPMKDMGETAQRLTQACELQENLTALAQRHRAQELNGDQSDVTRAIRAQNDAIRGGMQSATDLFPEFHEPYVTVASPVGIQTTTAGSTHIASDQNLAATAGGHVAFAAGRSFFASVRNGFSLFVQMLGIKLIAASGRVRVEAQSDSVEVIAQKVLELMSTTDWINIKAKKGVMLNGGGSTLVVSPEGIVGYTDGKVVLHCDSFSKAGAQSKPLDLPSFTTGNMNDSRPFSL